MVGLLALTCISITILACTCCHRNKSGFEVRYQMPNAIPNVLNNYHNRIKSRKKYNVFGFLLFFFLYSFLSKIVFETNKTFQVNPHSNANKLKKQILLLFFPPFVPCVRVRFANNFSLAKLRTGRYTYNFKQKFIWTFSLFHLSFCFNCKLYGLTA